MKRKESRKVLRAAAAPAAVPTAQQHLPPGAPAIWRLPQVSGATGLSRSTVLRLESEGKFPSRVRLSKRSVGWRSADVMAWIESRTSVQGEART